MKLVIGKFYEYMSAGEGKWIAVIYQGEREGKHMFLTRGGSPIVTDTLYLRECVE